MIWKQRFYELCFKKKYQEALNILNNNIQELVDLTNKNQRNEFKELSKYLLPGLNSKEMTKNQIMKMRIALYEEILKYMPSEKTM